MLCCCVCCVVFVFMSLCMFGLLFCCVALPLSNFVFLCCLCRLIVYVVVLQCVVFC